MCEYVTIALAIGAAIAGAVGQQQQARAQAKSLNYNAAVAENNALVSEGNKRRVQESQMQQEQQQRNKINAMIGQQRAEFGASGVDVGFGSALDVQASTAMLGYEDILSIRTNSKAQEDALTKQGADFINQANLLRTQAKNTRIAANINTFSSLLGSAAQAYSMGSSAGMFGGGSGAGVSYGFNPTNPQVAGSTGSWTSTGGSMPMLS